MTKRIYLKNPVTLNNLMIDRDMVFAYQHGEVYRALYDASIQNGFRAVEDTLLTLTKNEPDILDIFCRFLPELEINRWVNQLPKVNVFIKNSLVTL